MKSSRRYTETALDEIKLLRAVQSANPSHPGYEHVVSFLDSFEHPGLHGQPHVCMVRIGDVSPFGLSILPGSLGWLVGIKAKHPSVMRS